jgi:hypothetical protein
MTSSPKPAKSRRSACDHWRGWSGLLAGLALLWLLIAVILPWGQTLPGLRPVMIAISASDVDASTYWYSQSEKTAVAQNYIRSALRHQKAPAAVREK